MSAQPINLRHGEWQEPLFYLTVAAKVCSFILITTIRDFCISSHISSTVTFQYKQSQPQF